MRGLGAASAYRTEIDSLMRQAKAAMTTINATPMSDGARRGAVSSYNQLLIDAELLRGWDALNSLDPDDFRMFKADVQGFLTFATDPASFGVMEPPSPAPEVATPTPTMVPSASVIDPARSYLIWGGVALGGLALGLGAYGYKKGWFKRRRRR